MNQISLEADYQTDRIEGNKIILSCKSDEDFPKILIIRFPKSKKVEVYRLVKSQYDKFQLNR